MVLKRTSSGSYSDSFFGSCVPVAIWKHVSAVMTSLRHSGGFRSFVLLQLALILQDSESSLSEA